MKRAFNFATITAFNSFTIGLIKNQKETLESQKKSLENTVKQLEQEIKSLTAENEAAASQIASMQSQIASLQGTPHGGGSIAGLRVAIAALKAKIQANKQKIQAAKAMVISSKMQIQKIGGTLSKIQQQEQSIQSWLKKLIPDIQDIDDGASGKIGEKKGDLLSINGQLRKLMNKFTQKHLNEMMLNGTKNYQTGQVNKLPNTGKNPDVSNIPFDGKTPKTTPTVAVVDDAAVGALLLLFALGLISKEQIAEAIGATVEAIGGILDQLKNGLISIGAAIGGIMSNAEASSKSKDDSGIDSLPSQGTVTGDVPGAPPVDAGKQGKHVHDHPNNVDPDRTTWPEGETGVHETQEAWQNGTTLPDGSKVWDSGKVIGENGETGVRVHQDPKGNIHGYPVDPNRYLP